MLNKIFIVSISSFKNHDFGFNFNFQLKSKEKVVQNGTLVDLVERVGIHLC